MTRCGGSTFVRAEGVLWRRVADGVLLLPPGSAEPVMLAGSGQDVWQALERPLSLGGLAAVLCGRYEVDPEHLVRVLPKTLDELERRGAVRREAPA